MAIKKTVYPHSVDYARENGELDAYRESNEINRDCAASIDKAINESNYEPFHYDLKTAMQNMVKTYGEKRVAWVMAAMVQLHDYDGRYSPTNKRWAQGFSIPREQHYGDSKPRIPYYGTNAHPTVVDSFINRLREHLERIPNEAKRIIAEMDKIAEPNSPVKTHFTVKVDTDFLNGASSNDTTKLLRAIPYKNAYLSNLTGERGIFVFVKQDEIMRLRNKHQKPSLTGALKEAAKLAAANAEPAKTAAKKKSNHMEVD